MDILELGAKGLGMKYGFGEGKQPTSQPPPKGSVLLSSEKYEEAQEHWATLVKLEALEWQWGITLSRGHVEEGSIMMRSSMSCFNGSVVSRLCN